MADVQAEHGFVMIALDLFAALMAADLPNRCMIVLTEHLAASYGPTKHREVFLDPASIEDHSGVHRNNARRAIKELVVANILLPQTSGAFKFNKDYETWKPGGESLSERLNGGPIKHAKGIKDRYEIRKKRSTKDPIQPDSKTTPKTTPKTTNTSTTGPIQRDSGINDRPNPTGFPSTIDPIQRDSPYNCRTGSNGIGPNADASDVTHDPETRYGLASAHAPGDFKNLEKREEESPLPLSSVSESKEKTPKPPVTNDPSEVDRVVAKADRLFPDCRFGTKVRLRAGDYTMAVMEFALDEASDSDVDDWKYVMKIARRVSKTGIPAQSFGAPRKSAPLPPMLPTAGKEHHE